MRFDQQRESQAPMDRRDQAICHQSCRRRSAGRHDVRIALLDGAISGNRRGFRPHGRHASRRPAPVGAAARQCPCARPGARHSLCLRRHSGTDAAGLEESRPAEGRNTYSGRTARARNSRYQGRQTRSGRANSWCRQMPLMSATKPPLGMSRRMRATSNST